MPWHDHPWEKIFADEGHRYPEPFLGFPEVVRIFKENGCSEILDLGCGTGRHAVHLSREGFSAVGVDISMTGLRLTRAWAKSDSVAIPLALVDTRQGLPFAPAVFDGVFSTNVIYHARQAQVRQTIAHIDRVLRPGGLVFVTVIGRLTKGGPFIEIEPSTLVPTTGTRAGLPHYIFTVDTLGYAFGAFHVLEITRRADGAVLAIWARKRSRE